MESNLRSSVKNAGAWCLTVTWVRQSAQRDRDTGFIPFERLEHGLKPVSQQSCQKGALGNTRERNLRFSLDNEDASCLTAGRVGHELRQIFKEP